MGGGGGGGGQQKFMQGKKSEKKARKNPKKKFMHKMGRILILNQNYNSPRRVFQNAPNGIRACLDFQNFSGEGCPRIPLQKWASRLFLKYGRDNLPNAESRTPTSARNKITETSKT